MSREYKAIYMNMATSVLVDSAFHAADDQQALEIARSKSKFPLLLSKLAVYSQPNAKGKRDLSEIRIRPDQHQAPDITIIDHGEMS